MPGPTGFTQGAIEEGIASLEKLALSVEDLSDSAESSATQNALLGKSLDDVEKSTNKSKSALSLYTVIANKLNVSTKNLTKSSKLAANELAKASGILSSTAQKENDQKIQFYENAITNLQTQGGAERELAILNVARRKSEFENYESMLTQSIELGKLQVSQGKVVEGTWKGITGRMQLAGSKSAQWAGSTFGLPAKSMLKLAKVAGIALSVFTIFKTVVEGQTRSMVEAVRAGAEYDKDFSKRIMAGRASRTQEIALRSTLLSPFGAGDVLESVSSMQSEYISGLVASGDAYRKLAVDSSAARNEIRQIGVIPFTADIMKVSGALGLADNEAVQLATQMGVLTKSGTEPTRKSFLYLAQESKRLGLPINDLVSSFSTLASVGSYLGTTVDRVSAQTIALTDTLFFLQKEGVRGFQNMDPEKMKRFTQEMSTFLGGMDEYRLMAITQTPAGTFGQALSRVEGMSVSNRASAIESLMKRMGLSGAATEADPTKAFKLAKMLGFSGSVTDTIKLGRQMAALSETGNLTEDAIQARIASVHQAKFDEAKSAGAYLAGGGSILNYMANRLDEILRVLQTGLGRAMFGTGGQNQIAPRTPEEAGIRRSNYRNGGQIGRTVNRASVTF